MTFPMKHVGLLKGFLSFKVRTAQCNVQKLTFHSPAKTLTYILVWRIPFVICDSLIGTYFHGLKKMEKVCCMNFAKPDSLVVLYQYIF